MQMLISNNEYTSAKWNEKIPFICIICDETFYRRKRDVNSILCNTENKKGCCFCSRKCYGISKTNDGVSFKETKCKQCNIYILKRMSQVRRTVNDFCSRSCAVTYHNTNKTIGNRRSKLEIWLEKQLPILYPNINFIFNQKDIINSELDIYIPSLNLAFELNGIFHYEPIYGAEKLASIQNNDNRKFQACLEKSIELVIIDTTGQKYFKELTSKKYLSIINDVIITKLLSKLVES